MLLQPKVWMAAAILSFCFIFSACKKQGMPEVASASEEIESASEKEKHQKEIEFYGLSDNNQLVKYSGNRNFQERSAISLTGLQSSEKILAIDFRPATGQLYGVSNQSRIYIINYITGASVAVGTSPFTPAINGSMVGFDFNPTVDRIRLVTDSKQNLRLNPETGTVVGVDGNLNPGNPAVVAAAYTNSEAGAVTTTLYDIDVTSDKLFIQNPPNGGTLIEVGSLGINAEAEGGFDISIQNSIALAVLYAAGNDGGSSENGSSNNESNGKKYRFYYINLDNGRASNAGKTDRKIIGLAIPTPPVAYAVDAANNLLIFNPFTPKTIVSKAITTLQTGEKILGIDMRPLNGQLYALGSSSRLYTINLSNGAATVVGSGFTPALNGTAFGFDFNPVVDRIRVVSNTGQNLRLHPVTGLVAAVDDNLKPGMPMVDAAAYSNNFPGTTVTTLYDIDYANDNLYIQNPPNSGTLVLVGSLGVNAEAGDGFDIGGTSGKAYAMLRSDGRSILYYINLTTGRALRMSGFTFAANGFALGLGF